MKLPKAIASLIEIWHPHSLCRIFHNVVVDYGGEPPRIVCICGSTRFKDDYLRAQREFTLDGWIVLSVGLFGHEEGLDMNSQTKLELDELHKRKIDLADIVFVVNKDGYVGSSTRSEMDYAASRKTPVFLMEAETKDDATGVWHGRHTTREGAAGRS